MIPDPIAATCDVAGCETTYHVRPGGDRATAISQIERFGWYVARGGRSSFCATHAQIGRDLFEPES